MPKERKWDGIFLQLFLDRALVRTIPESLNTGGVFLFAHPTQTNLENTNTPVRDSFLQMGKFTHLPNSFSQCELSALMKRGEHPAGMKHG